MSFLGPIVGKAVVQGTTKGIAKRIMTRVTGGISKSPTVNKVYQEGAASPAVNSVKVVAPKKTQAQINAEGAARAREAMGLPPKPTAQEIAKRASQEKIRLQTSRIKRGN